MEKSGITIWHKLGIAGLFLALIAMAVGDEDKPGLLAIAKTSGEEKAQAAGEKDRGNAKNEERRDAWNANAAPNSGQPTFETSGSGAPGNDRFGSPFGNYDPQAREGGSDADASSSNFAGGSRNVRPLPDHVTPPPAPTIGD